VDDVLDVKYARTPDGLHIAYATVGDSGPPVVLLIGATTHLRIYYEEPVVRRFNDQLTSFCRLVLLDERGAGMSDPVPLSEPPTLEERIDDVVAVMDELGLESASVVGLDHAGPLALMLAGTHPERVDRLVVYGSYAALANDGTYSVGAPPELLDRIASNIGQRWGTGYYLDRIAPSADEAFRERWVRYSASAASPGQAEALFRRNFAIDVRPVLPAITAPTLVLHRRGDQLYPAPLGRYIAEHIEGATFVELEGSDSLPFLGDVDALVAEISEFVTGERPVHGIDRLLVTILFSDIVDSTGAAARLGDRRWRELLDDHDTMVCRQLSRFRGRAVKHTGDGVLAAFDGPARAILCASALRDGARRLGLEIRSGLHTGECDSRGDDLSGIAVHIGARIGALAGPSEILVSGSVPPLVVGSGIEFASRGGHQLKGVPGTWQVFEVRG
jgi:class 3 adenylate cyclase